MLRPILIFAFIASLGGALFAFLQTKPQIELINSTLETTKESLAKSETAEKKASKEARENKLAKEATEKQLAETKESLDASMAKASELEVRSTKLSADLAKITTDRNDARNELAQWQATGTKPADINQLKLGKKAAEEVQRAKASTANLETIARDMTEVMTGIDEVGRGVEQSMVALTQAGKASQQISTAAEQTGRASAEGASASEECSKAAQEITQAVEDIASQADELQNG